jgi:hypothetical protein
MVWRYHYIHNLSIKFTYYEYRHAGPRHPARKRFLTPFFLLCHPSTLYFGPKAPKGLEANWIPTSGKKPYAMFRFYGPEEAFYNKTFKLADVELVK